MTDKNITTVRKQEIVSMALSAILPFLIMSLIVWWVV